ncbi:unnamed protein product, partial [Urochloa humidicola]
LEPAIQGGGDGELRGTSGGGAAGYERWWGATSRGLPRVPLPLSCSSGAAGCERRPKPRVPLPWILSIHSDVGMAIVPSPF